MTPERLIELPSGATVKTRIEGPEGAPFVVFSNSVLTDLTIWDAQAQALCDRFQVLRYDQRGHGGSSVTDAPLSFDDYGDDLLAVLDAHGVDSCSFVGLSMGAPTGLAAFKKAPEKFNAFAVMDGIAVSAGGRTAFWTERRETALSEGMALIGAQTAERWLPGATQDMQDALAAMIAGTPAAGFAAATHALSLYDYSDVLSTIAVPFLAIAGEKDGAMPETMRKQFADVAQLKFDIIDGAGHVPNFQKPEAVTASLAAFLDLTTAELV